MDWTIAVLGGLTIMWFLFTTNDDLSLVVFSIQGGGRRGVGEWRSSVQAMRASRVLGSLGFVTTYLGGVMSQ